MRKTERTQKALEALIEELVAYGAAALAAPLARPTSNGRPARRR